MSSPSVLRTVQIRKDYLKFSAGHFTLFDDGSRERLHGHDYLVSLELDIVYGDSGIGVDYRLIKPVLREVCDEIDEYVLLPTTPRIVVRSKAGQLAFTVDGVEFSIPAAGVKLLPIPNITVEELSGYVLDQLLARTPVTLMQPIVRLAVTVEAGPGQSGSSTWRRG
ncbi:MAG: 6-carboxytetrahydropterin synthase [Proteobacteria bacterium]|nr:6-carboxytetrahydropterin synthase [Pseudomonadota bacterium]HQR02915.1 6-carboxytetrahydropterin synthase [Rhodocyclaceae bacterium]